MHRKVPLRLALITASKSASFIIIRQAVPGDAGVVDQNVDPAEGLHRRVHQGLDLVGLGHVAPDGQGLGPQGLTGSHGLTGRGLVSGVAQHHIGAALGQLQADGPADVPGCRR